MDKKPKSCNPYTTDSKIEGWQIKLDLSLPNLFAIGEPRYDEYGMELQEVIRKSISEAVAYEVKQMVRTSPEMKKLNEHLADHVIKILIDAVAQDERSES